MWIVHRLDRLTSGLLILAKNSQTAVHLQNQFKHRLVHKEYLALVNGRFDGDKYALVSAKLSVDPLHHSQMIIDEVKGKHSETGFKLLWYDTMSNRSLVLCMPRTGRTHQIRVHLSRCCETPIVNDPVYGDHDEMKRNAVEMVIDEEMLKNEELGNMT